MPDEFTPPGCGPRLASHPGPAWRRGLRNVLLAGLALSLGGCASLEFYLQAVAGQFEIWRKQQPIDALLRDPSLPEDTRRKLQLVIDARSFAFSQLALPDNGSYRNFVQLERDYVVWNVFVAPPLSLQAEQSCFLVVGCLAYRGYFDEARAQRYAAEQRAAGFDVYVAGVAAYSTLGWFDDPVLSTIFGWGEQRIVEVLFHELAHQQLYVNDDSTFNESFAVALAALGMEHWQASQGEPQADTILARQRERDIMSLVAESRAALDILYASDATKTRKLAQKQQIFATLAAQYQRLKATWSGASGYDAWMQSGWNNAKLSSVVTYNELVPAFRALFSSFGGDFAAAYVHLKRIASMAPALRESCMRGYAERGAAGCPVSKD